MASSTVAAPEPDDTVANGGCVVETNFGEINADLPIRLAAIAKTVGFSFIESTGTIDANKNAEDTEET